MYTQLKRNCIDYLDTLGIKDATEDNLMTKYPRQFGLFLVLSVQENPDNEILVFAANKLLKQLEGK